MANVGQNITIQARSLMKKAIDTHILYQIGIRLGQLIVNLIKMRTDAGYDIYGRKFKPYSAMYKKLKQRVIQNQPYIRTKSGKIRKSRYIERLIKQKKPGMAARAVNDYMHLTGQLWSDLSFDLKKPTMSLFGRIKIPIQFYVAQKSVKKAMDLKRMGRDMFGLAKAGAFKDKEEYIIRRTLVELMKNQISNVNIRVS